MAGLNQATLIGNVGADPEIRTTQSGTKVASFNIATSKQWKDRTTGEKKERTEWHRIVVWAPREGDGLVGTIEQYVHKGSKLFVQGEIKTRSWEGDDGNKRYTTEIVLQGFGAQLILLDSQGKRPPAATSPDDYGAAQDAPARGAGQEFGSSRKLVDDMDDEIPF